MREDDWRMDGAPDDRLQLNLEMEKATDDVSTPPSKRVYGLVNCGKTVGGKDLKNPPRKKLPQAHPQISGGRGMGSYDGLGNLVSKPSFKRSRSMSSVSSGKIARPAETKKSPFFAEKQKPKQGRSQTARSTHSTYPRLQLKHVSEGRGNAGGVARSTTGGQQPEREIIGPEGTGEKKPSPLARHPDNGSPARKSPARIVPGFSLDGFCADSTPGAISRGAGGMRTKRDIHRTMENARERAKQADREKEKGRCRWEDVGNTDRRQGAEPSVKRTYGKSALSTTWAAERREVKASSPKRELVTVEDSSCDEAPEEEVKGKLKFDSMRQDVSEGNPADDGGSSESPIQDRRVYDLKGGDEKYESQNSTFGTIPEFDAEAVMVGSHVVFNTCHMKITMNGQITLSLKMEGEEAKDTTLDIPEGDITFFGFSKAREKSSKALVAIQTRATGKVASDPRYKRKYDPVDKGAAGLITVFLPQKHTFKDHAETILDVLTTTREGGKLEGVIVDLDMNGELPAILRRTLDRQRTLEKEEQELGRVRTRRTLRSGGGKEEASRVLLHYPPELLANDRIAITVLDEARTQEGEFLNDSLVDLYLKHMHREAFRSWEPKASGESMDDGEVHVFTSHFFTKLTESSLDSFDVAYKKVQHWSRNVDLFSKKFVFVPVVDNMHWSLACIANLNKLEIGKDRSKFKSEEECPCMLFMDSLGMHQSTRIYKYLSRYLEEKWRETGRENITLDKRTFPLVLPNVPTQINGCDCGVYVLRYAKEICQQWPQVTCAHVRNRLADYFKPELFSPNDILVERRNLKGLLGECKIRSDKEKKQRQQQEKANRSKGKDAMVRGYVKDEEKRDASSAVIISAAVSASSPEPAVLTPSDNFAAKPVTAEGGTSTREEQQDGDMYCTSMGGDEAQEKPGGGSQEFGGLEVEGGEIEREHGVSAPVRRKKKLQPESTADCTLAATTLAVKDGEGSGECGQSTSYETEETGKGQDVEVGCSVQQSGGEGSGAGVVPSRARADTASGGPVGPSSVGHKARGTSPVRRRRYPRSPTRNPDKSDGGNPGDTITGRVPEAFLSEGVPPMSIEVKRQKPISPQAQPEVDSDRMVAKTFKLADEADSYEAKAKAVKSASIPISSPVTPIVAAAVATSPRPERAVAMEDLREKAGVKGDQDEVRVGMEHRPLLERTRQSNVPRSEEIYLGGGALQRKNTGMRSEMTSVTASTTTCSRVDTSLSLFAEGKGPTTMQSMDVEDVCVLETAAHAASSRLATPKGDDANGCGTSEGVVEKAGSCDGDLHQEYTISIAERLKTERLEGGRGGDNTSPRGRLRPPSDVTVPSSPDGTPKDSRKRQKPDPSELRPPSNVTVPSSPDVTPKDSRKKQKPDPSPKEVEVVESPDYSGMIDGQGEGGAARRRVSRGASDSSHGSLKQIEGCERGGQAGKARREGKGVSTRRKRPTKCSRVEAVLSDSGEETVSEYDEMHTNVLEGDAPGGDSSDKDEEWTSSDE